MKLHLDHEVWLGFIPTATMHGNGVSRVPEKIAACVVNLLPDSEHIFIHSDCFIRSVILFERCSYSVFNYVCILIYFAENL